MSFGSGDSPSNTQFSTQYTRDAPQIEAAKLGLMDTAKGYTMFGMNPWERVAPDAKVGEEGYGQYRYQGDARDHRYDPTPVGVEGEEGYLPGGQGRLFKDLTRGQRMAEGQVNVPEQPVAGFDPMQNKAFQMANQGVGSFQPYLNQATQYSQQATQQYDPNAYKQYMNPYQDEVISGIEQQFDKAGNKAAAQAGSAFGTERYGVQEAELASQRAQAVGQAQAQNYGQAQQAAVGQFQNQMGRYGEAAQQMAGLGGQQQQQQMGDIGSMMSSGSVQQQRQQQLADAGYQQSLQQLYEPYQRLGFTSDIYQGNVPSGAMAISMGTAPGSNPLAQTVGAGISGLAAYQGYQNMTG